MNGVSPAGSPSLPLGDGPGGETPPELAGETPALLPGRFMGPLGIAPDPIAFLDFCAATGGEERRFTAIVRLVPAHRVEHELTVVGLLVVERLARDGKFDAKKAQKAFVELGVSTDKIDPARA